MVRQYGKILAPVNKKVGIEIWNLCALRDRRGSMSYHILKSSATEKIKEIDFKWTQDIGDLRTSEFILWCMCNEYIAHGEGLTGARLHIIHGWT